MLHGVRMRYSIRVQQGVRLQGPQSLAHCVVIFWHKEIDAKAARKMLVDYSFTTRRAVFSVKLNTSQASHDVYRKL